MRHDGALWVEPAWGHTLAQSALPGGAAGGLVGCGCSNLNNTRPGVALRWACAHLPDGNPWPLDLSRQQAVKDFAQGLLAEGKPLEVLVNNAGIPPAHEPAAHRP